MAPTPPPGPERDPDRAKYTAAAILSGCFLLLAIASLLFGIFCYLLFGFPPHDWR